MDIYQTKYLEKLKGSRPDRLIICGMGGSGLPGEIIDTFKTELGITSEITIWKDYGGQAKHSICICVVFRRHRGNYKQPESGA